MKTWYGVLMKILFGNKILTIKNTQFIHKKRDLSFEMISLWIFVIIKKVNKKSTSAKMVLARPLSGRLAIRNVGFAWKCHTQFRTYALQAQCFVQFFFFIEKTFFLILFYYYIVCICMYTQTYIYMRNCKYYMRLNVFFLYFH